MTELHWYRCPLCGTVRALKRELDRLQRCAAGLPVLGWANTPNEQVISVACCPGILEPVEAPVVA